MQPSKNAFVLIFLMLLSGTAAFAQTQTKKGLTLGRVENSKYLNDYFGLELKVPEEWVIQSKEFNKDLKERGKETLKEGSELEDVVDLAMSRTFVLLTVSKYEIGSVDYNPTIVIVAERVDDVPGITKGSQYLDHSKKFLKQSKLPYEISDGYDEIKLDGKNFYVMNTKVQVTEEKAMMQKYISTIEKGFALSYIVSYSEKDAEKEYSELMKIIEGTKFNPASK